MLFFTSPLPRSAVKGPIRLELQNASFSDWHSKCTRLSKWIVCWIPFYRVLYGIWVSRIRCFSFSCLFHALAEDPTNRLLNQYRLFFCPFCEIPPQSVLGLTWSFKNVPLGIRISPTSRQDETSTLRIQHFQKKHIFYRKDEIYIDWWLPLLLETVI